MHAAGRRRCAGSPRARPCPASARPCTPRRGRAARASVDGLRAGRRLADDARCRGAASRIVREPARTSAWSSTSSTLIVHPLGSSARRSPGAAAPGRTHDEPAGAPRPASIVPPSAADALAHADEPEPAGAVAGGRRGPTPSSATSSSTVVGQVAQPHVGPDARARVLAHVRQRLLRDPVQVERRERRQPRRGSPTTWKRRRQARRRALPRRARGSARRRASPTASSAPAARRPARAASRAAVQLVDGLARGVLDVLQRLAPPAPGRSSSTRARRRGLHAHERHVVRDHVVQLTGQAQPLDRHRLRLGPDAARPAARACAARVRARSRADAHAWSPNHHAPREVQDVRQQLDQHVRDERREHAHPVERRRAPPGRSTPGTARPAATRTWPPRPPRAHPRGPAPRRLPGADGVQRHEQRDVDDEHLGHRQGRR